MELELTDTHAAGSSSPAPAPVSGSGASDSLVCSWSGPKIRELVRSTELRGVYERWKSRAESKLPRLNELLGSDQQAGLNNAMLLTCVPNDFVFVHHGAASVKMIGTNLTGMLFSERKSAIATAVRKIYTNCVEAAEPIYIRHVATSSSQQHFFLEQIVLPLAADERRQVGLVLVYSAPLDDKNEVLKTIFDRSQIGMIAAASSHDESGRLQDGRILMINERARKILKLPDSIDLINTVRDLGPWFRDGAMWTKTDTVTEGAQTHIHYRDRSTDTSYRVTVEPIERFVLFSIIEIPTIQ